MVPLREPLEGSPKSRRRSAGPYRSHARESFEVYRPKDFKASPNQEIGGGDNCGVSQILSMPDISKKLSTFMYLLRPIESLTTLPKEPARVGASVFGDLQWAPGLLL